MSDTIIKAGLPEGVVPIGSKAVFAVLVQKWRSQSDYLLALHHDSEPKSGGGATRIDVRAKQLSECADDLENAIAANNRT
jgi:hypothetical protein